MKTEIQRDRVVQSHKASRCLIDFRTQAESMGSGVGKSVFKSWFPLACYMTKAHELLFPPLQNGTKKKCPLVWIVKIKWEKHLACASHRVNIQKIFIIAIKPKPTYFPHSRRPLPSCGKWKGEINKMLQEFRGEQDCFCLWWSIKVSCNTGTWSSRADRLGLPLAVQQKWIRLVSMRMWVGSLALLRGSGLWCCHELWCRSQMWLRSRVAVALVWAGSCSSESTSSLGTPICLRCGLKKQK